jgi:hypothetical protein
MSDAPISDKEYQQAQRKAILMRGMNRAVPKMHPGDIGLPDVPAFDGQGRIDALHQHSASVETPTETLWLSRRPEHPGRQGDGDE